MHETFTRCLASVNGRGGNMEQKMLEAATAAEARTKGIRGAADRDGTLGKDKEEERCPGKKVEVITERGLHRYPFAHRKSTHFPFPLRPLYGPSKAPTMRRRRRRPRGPRLRCAIHRFIARAPLAPLYPFSSRAAARNCVRRRRARRRSHIHLGWRHCEL